MQFPDVSGEPEGAGVGSRGKEMGFPVLMCLWWREILPTSKIGISVLVCGFIWRCSNNHNLMNYHRLIILWACYRISPDSPLIWGWLLLGALRQLKSSSLLFHSSPPSSSAVVQALKATVVCFGEAWRLYPGLVLFSLTLCWVLPSSWSKPCCVPPTCRDATWSVDPTKCHGFPEPLIN